MSSETLPSIEDLPESEMLYVEEQCNCFEHAWKAWRTRPRPALEEHLAGVTGPAAGVLFCELLYLELAYRRQQGELPTPAEYLPRFPDRERLLRGVFAREGLGEIAAPPQTPDSIHPGDTGIDAPAARAPSSTRALEHAPTLPHVAGYEMLGVLGQGGMGIVYQARQVKADRLVALKRIRSGAQADEADLARFRTEVEASARLQHPNIVQIYEVGEHEGLPFFSMEFCTGGSLEKKLNGTPLPAEEAARLLETLARAMQTAHQKEVIHRDLKPANVLLADDGTPKITDFGLARKLDEVGQTQTGAIMGTPSYMAPEQARGQTEQIGPAADVYALGAILYECLTGRPPFKAATTVDTLLQVLHDEPVPPSRLQPKVPRDLETICLKCLQKEPAKRYAGAGGLAEDVRRYRKGEPIAARPVGQVERSWRWCRRNPAVAGLLTTVAATLVMGTAVAIGLAVWALAEAQHARDNEQHTLQEKEQKDRQLTRAEGLLYAGQLDRAQQYWREGNAQVARNLLDGCRWDYRGWEYRYLHTLFNASHLTFHEHAGAVGSVAFSPDGQRLASTSSERQVTVWDVRSGRELLALKGVRTSVRFSPDGQRLAGGSRDGTVRVWNAQTGQQLLALKGHTDAVNSVAFSPEGNRLASASSDRTVRLWDAQTGEELRSLRGHTRDVIDVCFSPDGNRLASASWDGTVRLWDARTGKELLTLNGHTGRVASVCFSPDGTRLASAGWDKTVKVWDAQTGQELRSVPRLWEAQTGEELLPHTPVTSICFSPDGRWLASAGHDQTVRLWEVQTGQEVLALKGHTGIVAGVCFSPDGKLLASASDAGTPDKPFLGEVKVWDTQVGQEALRIRGLRSPVLDVCFGSDGKRLASASFDGTVRLWDAQSGQELRSLQGHTKAVWSVRFSPDGKRLASGSDDGTVKLWEAQTGQELRSLQGHTLYVKSVAFSPDGERLASAAVGFDTQGKPSLGEVKVWDARSGQQLLDLTAQVSSVAFSPDGKRLAGGSWDATVKVWDAQTGQEVLRLRGHTGEVTSICFSPDGKRLASTSRGSRGEMKVWDAQTGQEVLSLQGPPIWVWGVCFSPDSQRLASAGYDKRVKVWDAQTGQEVLSLQGPTGDVNGVCFSPDGKRLASGSGVFFASGEVEVWDAETGQEVLALQGYTREVTGVCFSPDGNRVVASNEKGEARAWDALTGQPIIRCTDPPPPQQQQATSPDGQRLVRIVNGQPVVQPRVLKEDNTFRQRLDDLAREHFWHLRMAQEAGQGQDEFALAFHLKPLLLTAFLRWQQRPHDSFPYWAWRPPLSRGAIILPGGAVRVGEPELRRLVEELSRQLDAEPKAWHVWAARGWCRHLLGDADSAIADLKKSIGLQPEEPGLWAVLGTLCLKHNRLQDADAAHARLAAWRGLDVAVWDRLETEVCQAEQDTAAVRWHRDRK
jgi:WD40 repeat protein/tRNA A-37 threonylcarbamoyl transferase component Bud32